MPVYVITGANRGLGLEFVAQLSTDQNNKIFAGTRSLQSDLSQLKALNQHQNVTILECDVSSLPSVSKFAADIKRQTKHVDYLLNNGGINAVPEQDSLHIGEQDLHEHISVNVIGPAKLVQELADVLSTGSSVVNMTSGLGSMQETKGMDPTKCAVYSISKAGQNMLTLHQAFDLGPKGKSGRGAVVIAMDPGWVKTRMGGAGAVMEKEDSIKGMLKVIRGLTLADSGKFYTSSGEEKAW